MKINIIDIIYQSIPYQLLQQINSLAPDSIKVPSGSLIPVKYNAAGNNPTMAVRLQELFGLSESPTVNEGSIKLTIQILSPGFKPVQITSDLASFWKNTYPGVKKELKVKYLRHYWPDDPLNATALKGAKKRGMTYD